MDSGFKIDLSGKVAVVTGASSGMGEAIVHHLAAAGAQTLAVGRDPERLAAACAATEGIAEPFEADLTTEEAPGQVIEAVLSIFGQVDVVVHAAGIFVVEPFVDTTDADLDRQWDINVRAPFRLTREAVPHLRRGSSIIFISSIMGAAGAASCTAYCATKGAVELLVSGLAVELAPSGIRVNAIAPGAIETPMNQEMRKDKAFYDSFKDFAPAGRWGTVEDIAPAAVFLASDAADFFHGSRIAIDGGWIAR